MFWDSGIGMILVKGIYSNILERIGRSLIVLYDEGLLTGLLGYRKPMIIECIRVEEIALYKGYS